MGNNSSKREINDFFFAKIRKDAKGNKIQKQEALDCALKFSQELKMDKNNEFLIDVYQQFEDIEKKEISSRIFKFFILESFKVEIDEKRLILDGPKLQKIYKGFNFFLIFVQILINSFGHKEKLKQDEAILQRKEELDVENCNLHEEDLPRIGRLIIEHSKTIKILNLSKSNFGFETLSFVFGFVKECKLLEKIYLYKSNITNYDMELLAEILKNNESLKTFNVNNNEIRNEGVKFIVEALSNNTRLESLSLAKNNIKNEGVLCLAQFLQTNKSLKSVDISSNVMDFSNKNLVHFFLSSFLTHLNLAYCGINSTIAVTIFDELKNNKRLFFLKLKGNEIGIEGIKNFSECLLVNDTLKTIDISLNKLTDEEIKILSKSLEINKALKTIYLCSNVITDNGIFFLFNILKTNSTLKEIYISHNLLSDKGANEIADVLKTRKSMELLDISSCKIGSTGVENIFESLKSNNSLKFLKISHLIGSLSSVKIAECIQKNTTLIKLDLSSSNFGDKAGKSILKSLNENNTIKEINLEDCKISPKILNEIKQRISEIIGFNKLVKLTFLLIYGRKGLLLSSLPKAVVVLIFSFLG